MLPQRRRGSGVRFNRRDSKSRVPSWHRGFESPPLRHAKSLIFHDFCLSKSSWGQSWGRFGIFRAPDRSMQQSSDPFSSTDLKPRNPFPIVAKDHLFGRSAYLCNPTGIFSRRERERNKRVANAILTSFADASLAQRGLLNLIIEPFLIEWSSVLTGKNEILWRG
jgi:hypothetical protein